MRVFFILLAVFFGFTAAVSAQPGNPIHFQENILRVAPDDSSAFVPLVKPHGGSPTVEVLSRQGEWEEVRLHYRFKYNGSRDPNVCAMSLFEGTFTGFRKAADRETGAD